MLVIYYNCLRNTYQNIELLSTSDSWLKKVRAFRPLLEFLCLSYLRVENLLTGGPTDTILCRRPTSLICSNRRENIYDLIIV